MMLKEKMKNGTVFGLAVFTGACCTVESLANWGFDFVYLDLEHSPISIGFEIEKAVMSAKLAGISPLIRVTGCNEVEIRKALEIGAEGVVIPHIRTKEEAELCVRAAKFPPLGRRGAESNVRSCGFGGPDFSWKNYIEKSNNDTLVIPMAEDFEFIDNINEILSVPGIDAVNFGPIDYALSIHENVGYTMSDKVSKAFDTLVSKAQPKGIGILGPVVPATFEEADKMIKRGINMLILGNDMYHFNNTCKKIINECVEPLRKK